MYSSKAFKYDKNSSKYFQVHRLELGKLETKSVSPPNLMYEMSYGTYVIDQFKIPTVRRKLTLLILLFHFTFFPFFYVLQSVIRSLRLHTVTYLFLRNNFLFVYILGTKFPLNLNTYDSCKIGAF